MTTSMQRTASSFGAQWRTFDHHQATPKVSLGGTLGVIALAFGVGVLGAYMLDLHGHTCEACGHRWRHLGAFNLGDQDAHTCRKCGMVQWWKCGYQGAFKLVPNAPTLPAAARPLELREALLRALPSGMPLESRR